MRQYEHSNVKEFVFGEGALVDGLNQLKNYTVATSDPPWSSIEPHLSVKPLTTHIVTSVQQDQVDAMLRSTPSDTEYVVGIGGGQAIDVAKYIAYSLNRPIITAPTILFDQRIRHAAIWHSQRRARQLRWRCFTRTCAGGLRRDPRCPYAIERIRSRRCPFYPYRFARLEGRVRGRHKSRRQIVSLRRSSSCYCEANPGRHHCRG